MLTLTLATLASSAFAQQRIVGGEEVRDFNTFPEVVHISVGGGGCTGSLIHAEWVLTAAHCFSNINIANNPTGGSPAITFGWNVNNQGTEQRVFGNLVIIHEGYTAITQDANGPNTGIMNNDIALIRLAEPVARQVMAVNTQPLDESWIGLPVTAIGFGITQSGGGGSGQKRFVEVPIHSYNDMEVFDFDPVNNFSTCQGDSGGPSVYYQGAGYIQTGITSYGRECGTGLSASMRVDAQIDWIEDQLPEGVQLLKVAASPPTFECSHQLDPDSDQSIALGIVPMTLRCEVTSSEPDTITEVEWRWGDGSPSEIVTDLRATHVYDDMGVYSLTACVRGDRDGIPYENCVSRANHVNVCGPPAASFEVAGGEGLSLDLVNTTPLRAYTCITNAKWEVYEGDSVSGTPVREYSNWDPQITVDAPGTYTVVLNVGGLGGTGAARGTVKIGSGSGCSTSPVGWAPAFLLPLGLLGLRRRRA